MDGDRVVLLLVEDNKDFAKLLGIYLQRHERDRFHVVWKENAADALAEIGSNPDIDVILMDYFLPGKNGLEITQELRERNVRLPVVFLTVNKDFDVVLKVMKQGVADYLVKEEISSPVLPKTILGVIERQRLLGHLEQAEISRHRLDAIKETLATVMAGIETPLTSMQEVSAALRGSPSSASQQNYLKIVDDNVNRLVDKLAKLKGLKEDKTIQYIKDIRMLDLS